MICSDGEASASRQDVLKDRTVPMPLAVKRLFGGIIRYARGTVERHIRPRWQMKAASSTHSTPSRAREVLLQLWCIVVHKLASAPRKGWPACCWTDTSAHEDSPSHLSRWQDQSDDGALILPLKQFFVREHRRAIHVFSSSADKATSVDAKAYASRDLTILPKPSQTGWERETCTKTSDAPPGQQGK